MTERNFLIRDRLVDRGRALMASPRRPIQFAGDPEADSLVSDLDGHPHAFVLACVMDRQIKAERAWKIPFRISKRLGGFTMEHLRHLSLHEVVELMRSPEPLHRFAETMAGLFHSAVRRIDRDYSGDASRIWAAKPSSAEVVYRFLQFDGIGPKIATMAVNILAREFQVPFSDHFSIDISADVHVRRVFGHLGLTDKEASVEQVIYRARALHPEFPGLMDLPCWEIGRNWCKAREAECGRCYLSDLCPSSDRQQPS